MCFVYYPPLCWTMTTWGSDSWLCLARGLYDPEIKTAISGGTLWSGRLAVPVGLFARGKRFKFPWKPSDQNTMTMVNKLGRIISPGNPWRTGIEIWSKEHVWGTVGWSCSCLKDMVTWGLGDVGHWGKLVVWVRNVPTDSHLWIPGHQFESFWDL